MPSAGAHGVCLLLLRAVQTADDGDRHPYIPTRLQAPIEMSRQLSADLSRLLALTVFRVEGYNRSYRQADSF